MEKSIRDVLKEFREHSLDERDKGARFEQLMKGFLQRDTQYQRLFDEVWLWSDYPERGNRPDTGIDLVARERDTGELVAIQCKFYAPDALISKPDIDSFLASSSKAEFKGRMFITTSDNWGKNAEEAIAGQKPEVARLGLTDLDESSIDWSKFSFQSPQDLEKKPRKTPRPHQEESIKSVLAGFKEADRGKLIMACGTGKTFTSLKLVERMFPNGGTILFLVPSISLLSQALKEWTIEAEANLRSYAVCSDVSVGKRKNDEDLPVTDLAFPATTNTERLVEKFAEAGPNQNGLTVIFSTYQSIDVVAQAQSRGIPEFDLIVCDEAHRTTGVTLSGDDESAFVKVHNQGFIKGKKRLYMTATPKVFSDASSKKAEEAGAVLADMGKPDMFGEEFHRLGFGEAVERGILTDYKVLVLAVDEAYVARRFQRQFADDDNELKLEDAAKIVGCWNGLSKRSTEQEEFEIDPGSMKRAVAFARSIAESKKIASMFQAVVDEETAQLDDDEAEYLRCEVEHVDGSFNSLRRNEKLDWLRQEVPDNTARILSNARCLTEGVDVPALDAVMFLNPRDSQVDVVQAVGRVMRKLEGKKYGYVILPIGVPADMDPATALNDNKKYKVVWQVLQALRSHDERFDAMVNKIDLTKKAPQIGIIGVGGGADGSGKDENGSVTLDFPNFDQWRDAILAKIVERVGEKRYWENWSKDVAEVAEAFMLRISALVDSSAGVLKEKFRAFVKGLQNNLNPSLTDEDAIEMLAQHLITKPIFDALFENYPFTETNPVSIVMQDMIDALQRQNLGVESDRLKRFYQSVRVRAGGIEDSDARQAIVKQLYEEFFRNAFTGTSERLGIVYTPNEVVDYLIHSVDHVLKEEFGTRISDPNIHIIDPFAGTGTFIVRLLASGLIDQSDLERKFKRELHANELVLLAYYVAAINIEEAYRAASGGSFAPFEGIVLTDTFQIDEADNELDSAGVFYENNARVVRQKQSKITVVIGNPPYSAGSRTSGFDSHPTYKSLDNSIRDSYARYSSATLKSKLYDSYVRAFRWASNRLGDSGVVAFITNSSFIDGNTADGLRKAFVEEFGKIYIYDLRGRIRGKSGDFAKREGGNVFPIMTGVAIAVLVKGGGSTAPADTINYYGVDDYLSGREKLSLLVEHKSVGSTPFSLIEPNEDGDWLNQRNSTFNEFIPLAPLKSDKANIGVAIFSIVSNGLKTNRDAWVYNFSKAEVRRTAELLVDTYNHSLESQLSHAETRSSSPVVDPAKISWSPGLKQLLARGKRLDISQAATRTVMYRPFQKIYNVFDRRIIERTNRLPSLFPSDSADNLGFFVPAPGNDAPPFFALMTNVMPDLGAAGVSAVQVFCRYSFAENNPDELDLLGDAGGGFRRVDNISDDVLAGFEKEIEGGVTKDELFFYLYGLLHSPHYRERYASDLKRSLPRVPILIDEFREFSAAGKELSEIHLGYESLEPHRLHIELKPGGLGPLDKLSFADEAKTTILYGSSAEVSGIPEAAHDYKLGMRSALEWAVERYRVRTDKESGITSDPNAWMKEINEPDYVLNLLGRLTTLSLQTMEIVSGLPDISEALSSKYG